MKHIGVSGIHDVVDHLNHMSPHLPITIPNVHVYQAKNDEHQNVQMREKDA